MGKMRFKLSLVMPNAWFYKLREVGKTPRITHHPYNNNPNTAPQQNRKHISPVNHKANDIPFPADTPKKTPISRSPLPPVAEDIAILSPLGPIEISIDNWPSIHSIAPGRVSTGTAASASMDEEYTEDDQFPGFSSANPNRASSVTFDVRELERRLKNLGSEDRRKYYNSPLLSEVIPSPMVPDMNNQQDVNHITSNTTGKNGNGSYGYLQPTSGMVNSIPRSPLKSIKSQGKPPLDPASFHHRVSSNGDPQSLRHSSTSISSSDTGFDRGSSSMWDKDMLSNITSDDSDVEYGNSMRTSSRMSNRKPKERSRSRSRPNSTYNSPMRNSDVAGMDLTALDNGNESSSIEMSNGDIRWKMNENYNSNGITRSSPRASPVHYQPSRRSVDLSESVTDAMSMSSWMHSKRQHHNLLEYDEMMMNQMSLVEYVDSNDMNRAGLKGHHRKLSTPVEFSYNGCKERLLSGGRKSLDYHSDKAASESEMETMSNYTKFKLMQKGCLMGHGQGNNIRIGGVSPDRGGNLFGKSPDWAGLYAKGSSPKHNGGGYQMDSRPNGGGYQMDSRHNGGGYQMDSKHGGHQMEQILNVPASSPNRAGSDVDVDRSSPYSNPHRSQSEHKTKSAASATANESSWCKDTLNAVREKTKEPNFKQFSDKSSNLASSATTNSRVFDSFAMMKCSHDPKQDFKESMLEMILEKDLLSSRDLVELLQCYLTLNAEKYHDTIVKAFTEVWAEVFQQGI